MRALSAQSHHKGTITFEYIKASGTPDVECDTANSYFEVLGEKPPTKN